LIISPANIFGNEKRLSLVLCAVAALPEMAAALPYTIIIEPGGKVIYAKEGAFDMEKLKKVIFDDPMLGRYINI
jgi:hypothetical protein